MLIQAINLTYIPHDYYRQIKGVWIDTNKSRTESVTQGYNTGYFNL